MTHPLRGKTACVGVATAGCGLSTRHTAAELMATAALRAIEDAQIPLSEVDGVFAANVVHSYPAVSLCEHLGITPRFSDGSNIGGSSFMAQTLVAAMALEAGLCNVALIAYGSDQRSAGGFSATNEPFTYEAPYKSRYPITSYALAANRYMHDFGASRRDLAEVAVAARKWAQLNPEALMRDDLTIEDVLAARMISDPLGKLDICLVTNGAAAIVMTRADRAKDGPHRPAYLLGSAFSHSHRMISEMADLTRTAAQHSGQQAFGMAGYSAADIDTAQLYDAFTINTLLFLEDLGFCAKGEAKDFVRDGGIAPGGRLPVNTNGGGLSCVHPGMYGLFLMIEAVRQIRGAPYDRLPGGWIDDVNLCLAHGNGGVLTSQATTIWGSQATL
jgi:acetyl-CoA acetyltransferase